MNLMIRLSHKLHGKGGFTMAEMLVVLCLLALLSGFFLQCYVFVMEQYRHRIALMELEENLTIAMDLIAADFAEAIGVADCSVDSLSILKSDGTVYYTTGTDTQAKEHFYDLTGKILYRRENTQWNRQPMANFISGFCVSYYNQVGEYTAHSSDVSAVEVKLEGTWNDTVITQRHIAELKDSYYF